MSDCKNSLEQMNLYISFTAAFYFKDKIQSLNTLESSYVKISAIITSGFNDELATNLTGISNYRFTVFFTLITSWVKNFVKYVN